MPGDLIFIISKRNLAFLNRWWQVTLGIQPEKADAIALALEALGAIAITYRDGEDNPIFEPELNTTPLWKSTLITGLFSCSSDKNAGNTLVENLRQQLDLEVSTTIKLSELEDQEWTRSWLQYFQPMQFGKNLWIIPEGFDVPHPSANNLFLDPGLAFGTGTHPTTAMCLSWLDANAPVGLEVLDFGCGSGILTVAAAVLGAQHIDAIDIDPQAIIATHSNAEKNNCLQRVHSCLPEELEFKQYDLILANILAGPLTKLSTELARYCRTDGTLILSGILTEQANELKSAYLPWFSIENVTQQEDWICLQCRRH